jgi:hypothetical protein
VQAAPVDYRGTIRGYLLLYYCFTALLQVPCCDAAQKPVALLQLLEAHKDQF